MSQANLSALLRRTDIRRFGALNNTQTGLSRNVAVESEPPFGK